MRHILTSALILPAALLTGCSMAGTGDYFADREAACSSNCANGGYTVAPQTIQEANGQFGPAQTPDGHAYGAAYGNGPIVPQYQTGPERLRGAYQGFGQSYNPGFAPAYVAPKSKRAYAYGSVGAQMYDVENEVFGLQGRVGYQTASIIGAELEGSFGVNKDDGVGVNSQFGAFALARIPLGKKINYIPRVGYHVTDLDAFGVPSDQDGLAYGSGLEYNLNPNMSLRADYTMYDGDSDGLKADSVSLSVLRKF